MDENLVRSIPESIKGVNWKVRLTCSDSVVFSKNSDKEDKESEVRDAWEKEEPGRKEKAKNARERYLTWLKRDELEADDEEGKSKAEMNRPEVRNAKKKGDKQEETKKDPKAKAAKGKAEEEEKPQVSVTIEVEPNPTDHKNENIVAWLTHLQENRQPEHNIRKVNHDVKNKNRVFMIEND